MLERRVEAIKMRTKVSKIRDNFETNPAKSVIERRGASARLDPGRTTEFYEELYSPLGGDKPRTPAFNRWLDRWKDHKGRTEPVKVGDTAEVRKLIELTLKESRPWKAPGEDGIPAGAYKLFPSAKAALVRFIEDPARKETIVGTRCSWEGDSPL